MKDMNGVEVGVIKPLDTQSRIGIAQCLNLAIELDPEASDDNIKKNTKRFWKIKCELEQEYSEGKF